MENMCLRVHLHDVVTRDVRLSFIQQAKPSLQYGQSVKIDQSVCLQYTLVKYKERLFTFYR